MSLVRPWKKTCSRAEEILVNGPAAQKGKAEPHPHGTQCGRGAADLNGVYSRTVEGILRRSPKPNNAFRRGNKAGNVWAGLSNHWG